jgi:predicted transposase YdaD
VLLRFGLGLMVLTTLEGEKATSEARGLIQRAEGSRDIIEIVSTIIFYKFNNLSRDEVDVMLGIELQQTRVYQEAKADGEKIVVLKMLDRKLGNINITPEIRLRVNNLSIEQLESLSESLLDFGQMSDLIGWLDAQ